ncbi:MAG: HEAT repeat domain-containing protein, partial [Planctomycetota bacterium]
TKLAERDGIKWALPETLAGNALVGGDVLSARAALDEACKQWNLAWTSASGIVVVHRADDAALAKWTGALKGSGPSAVEAAWELGWLRDGRALPALAEALARKDAAVALAAARAIEILDKRVPLGRTDRVDAVLPGRSALAAAFPPKTDLKPLLDSPYPPVRAAALRVLLGRGGAGAEAAKAKTAGDRSDLVLQVRQQIFFVPPKPKKNARPPEKLPDLPATSEAVKAECRKMIDAIPGFAKTSSWEQMRVRARIIANWSALGSAEATDALIELSGSKYQRFWYPAYVFKFMARTGGEKTAAALRARFAKSDRATLSRGLEKVHCGEALLSFTRPFLGEQTIAYVSARKAGREALEDLLALSEKAAKGHYSCLDTLGAVGGPKAIAALKAALVRDEAGETTLAFRSAKALGLAGGADALEALLAASKDGQRTRRHAATLYLGRIGGPKAIARLKEVLAS